MKTYTAAFIYKQAPKTSHKQKNTYLLFYTVIAYICFLIPLDSFNFFPSSHGSADDGSHNQVCGEEF